MGTAPLAKGSHIVVIGAGFGGLASAALLAKAGYKVTLVEKNDSLGGRARIFAAEGFTFDMGPSWYMMPDIFEHYFALLGKRVEDYLDLTRLGPSYKVFFEGDETVDMYSDLEKDMATFERLEPGCEPVLREYIEQAGKEYEIAKHSFLYRNYDSLTDLFNRITAQEGRKLSVTSSMHQYIARRFTSPKVQQILEYIMVFLGSSPYKTPAMYKMMSYLDFQVGIYYPQGGIHSVVRALEGIGTELGVKYRTSAPVARIVTDNGVATGVELEGGEVIAADAVLSNADMWHTETALLSTKDRTYSEKYWQKRSLAPSAFIMYLGVTGKVEQLAHHNLLFSKRWKENFDEVFGADHLPTDPSIYVSCPSRTDASVAPKGKENLFVLVPIAPNIALDDAAKEAYAKKVLERISQEMNIPDLAERICFKRIYTSDNFAADYNSLGGSALGLAHTLSQTALFRPNNVSKKVKNLFYVGAGTNPGIGVPICLISAEIAVKRIIGERSPYPLEKV